MKSFSKYAIEMFVSIAQIEWLLTARLSKEFRTGFFCNWTGRKTRNIEDNLAHEIYNNISKNALEHLGSNKPIQTIDKICRTTCGIKENRDNFDGTTKIHKSSTRHTERLSHSDEIEMIGDLLEFKPFSFESGRLHENFATIKSSASRYIKIVEHHIWLNTHIKQLSGQI